jgi:tRNA(fMet)-specific endonuclease VapC
MKYLLDTNIIIYWWKNNNNIENKIKKYSINNIAISFITLSELYYGAFKSLKFDSNILKIKDLLTKIELIESSSEISCKFGEIKYNQKKIGKTIDDADIFIASVALVNNLTLVTNNIKHFENIENLKLENWI